MTDSVESFHIPAAPQPCDQKDIRISVCIPSYNMGDMLIGTLKSVQAQTFPAHEIIVVNDGSTDHTQDVIMGLKTDIDFTYLQRETNQGVSKARNHAADHATGNWLLFLDGDDHLFPDALEHLSKHAAVGGGGVIVGRVQQVDLEKGIEGRERTFRGIGGDPPHGAKMNFWRSLIASPGAVLVHKSLHDAVGGFTKPWQPTEDRDYYIRLGACARFVFCDEFVLKKMYREQSMRIFSDIAVFWGAKVQMEFLDWCRDRNISPDFLETTPQEIISRNLRKAIRNHDADVIERLKEYAQEKDVSLPLFLRVRAWWVIKSKPSS